MNNVEINKTYICENIEQSEQAQFYNYFFQLEDHQHFESWSLEKTIQVVNNFKSMRKKSILSAQEHPQAVVQGIKKGIIDEKTYTSLNLLEQIQEKKAIKLNQSNAKPQKKQQDWLNIANISQFLSGKVEPIKFDNSLFQNFDLIINKQPLPRDKTQKNQNLTQKPTVQLLIKEIKEEKVQKQTRYSQTRQPEKQRMANSRIDKLFKQKINENIKCQKAENQINCTSIEIKSHEMIHRIFLPDYAMYNMEVKPANIICKRTYDDFVCLKKTLQRLHPCVKIPFIESGSWLSQNDIDLINKNKSHLMLFMKGIIEHPLLCKLNVVQRFLTTIEHKQIKKYFQELQNKSPKYLHEIVNLSGQLSIRLSSQQYELIKQLPKWQNIFEDYFQKYGDLLSNLSSQQQAIHNTYSQLMKLSVEMQVTLRNLTERNTQIERHSDFSLFFSQQQTYYSKKQKQAEEEAIKLNQILIPFCQYEKLNINQFKTDFESLQKLTDRYIKRLQNEPESPSSVSQILTLVNKNRLNDGIWEQSQNMQFFKLQLGFLHSSVLTQTQIYSNRLINNLNQVWSKIDQTRKQAQISKQRQSIKSWKF